MPDSKILDLLVVEDDIEDEQLICEALIEIEEQRMWGNWRAASVVYAGHLSEALDCLRRGRFDAVLLNLSLPDSSTAMETFLEAHACAGGAPIVILADQEDENLAHRLIREGAEDVLLKREVECAPLARAIRYSIERRRRDQANRISTLADIGTGTLNCQAFTTVAHYYTDLAVSQNLDLHLLLLEVRGIPARTAEDRQASEILLMRIADVLQSCMSPPVLIGRVGKCRFASILAAITAEEAESIAARTAGRIEELIAALPGAGIDLSVTCFRDADRLEALMAGPAARDARPLAKPVMLAD